MTDPNDSFTVNGDALFTTSTNHGSAFSDGNFTDGVLRLRGNFTQTRSGSSSSLNSFVSTGTRVVFDGSGTQNIFVANPGTGTSRFHDISIENTSLSSVVLTTDVVATGQMSSPPKVESIVTGPGFSLTVSGGLDVDGLILDGVVLVVAGGAIDRIDYVTFQNYSTDDFQFIISHPDMDATFLGLEFLSEPINVEGEGGLYIVANDDDGGTPARLTLLNAFPTDGSSLSATGGGFILEWVSEVYAVEDADTTLEDSAVSIDVLSNDMNPLGAILGITSVTDGENGAVVIDSGDSTVTYTPNPDFHGTDTFTYTVDDGEGTAVGVVTVVVISDQDPLISVHPVPLLFGSVPLGGSSARNLHVVNSGTDGLHVTDINSTYFTLSDTAFSVAVGDTHDVLVTFTPGSLDAVTDTLEIESNDPNSPTLVAEAIGSGAPVGDASGDNVVNILDVISLVNVVVGQQSAPENGDARFLRMDINGDGSLNILDLVSLINLILDVPPKPIVAATKGNSVMELGSGEILPNGEVRIPLELTSTVYAPGLQFSLRYDADVLQLGTPQPSDRIRDMRSEYLASDGVATFIVFSTTGRTVSPRPGVLFQLPVTLRHGGPDAALTLEGVILAGPFGESIPVLTNGTVKVTSIPSNFDLKPNRPNPFNPATAISYDVLRQTLVRLTVFNLLGQQVAKLVDEIKPAGRFTAVWNGRSADGESVASGVYIYRMTTGTGFTRNRRMTLLK